MPRAIYDPSTGRILGGALGGLLPSTTPAPSVVTNPAIPSLEVPPATRAYALPSGLGFGGGVVEPSAIAATTMGGAAMSIVPFVGGGLARVGGAALVRALPTIERVVARAVTAYGGAALVRQIYDHYVRFRQAGHGHQRARRMAHQAAGFTFRRRRMRATNVRALRRAIRRVRSFERIAHKLGALGVSRRGRPRIMHRRRRYYPRRRYRGDVDPFVVEDTADVYDEAEDLGYLDDEDVSEASGE